MHPLITDKSICIPSKKVVIRQILDDTIIVPLENGVSSSNDDFFTLNDSGKAMFRCFDGRQTLGEIAVFLADQYTSPKETILADLIEFCNEMLKRQILEVKN